jgi:hypothetical protein
MEDMKKPKMLKGIALGALVAVIVLFILAYLVLKQNLLQRYAVIKDGKVCLDWKTFSLELILPVVPVCLVLGGVLGHCCISD